MSDVVDPNYPAWRFHPTLPAKIVTAAEDATLDKDWVSTPAKLPAFAPPPTPVNLPAFGPAPESAPPPTEPPPPADLTPDPAPVPKKSHHKKKEPVD